MKLDVNALRYLSREDFRVLTAVEMGQKNVSRAHCVCTSTGCVLFKSLCTSTFCSSYSRIVLTPTKLSHSRCPSECHRRPVLQHEIVPVELITAIAGLK